MPSMFTKAFGLSMQTKTNELPGNKALSTDTPAPLPHLVLLNAGSQPFHNADSHANMIYVM